MADVVAVVGQDIVLGLMLGAAFAVVAHGLNLIWGVTKVVNIAHGEFIMLGAYGAYFLNLYLGANPLVAIPVDAVIGLGVGFGFYFLFLHRELRDKEAITLRTEMVTLVATFGLSLFVANLAKIVFTGNFVGIPWTPGVLTVSGISLPLGALYTALIGIGVIAATQVFLNRTYLGNAIRAYSQDISATRLMGINPTYVASVATAIGLSITMMGGALLTVRTPTGINPYLGTLYAPISFVIVVLG
ncbi:MAG TPA: branched-chain amino acid ABC transporter permease, partial [Thermoplasmata archaeon]|nr:branched-chain amino acid ABC transporter permease [Thermoplasmata archaeon]